MTSENKDRVVKEVNISLLTNTILEFAAERYDMSFDDMLDEIIINSFSDELDTIAELDNISDERMLKTKELWLARNKRRNK